MIIKDGRRTPKAKEAGLILLGRKSSGIAQMARLIFSCRIYPKRGTSRRESRGEVNRHGDY
jgi:hypothetical protein